MVGRLSNEGDSQSSDICFTNKLLLLQLSKWQQLSKVARKYLCYRYQLLKRLYQCINIINNNNIMINFSADAFRPLYLRHSEVPVRSAGEIQLIIFEGKEFSQNPHYTFLHHLQSPFSIPAAVPEFRSVNKTPISDDVSSRESTILIIFFLLCRNIDDYDHPVPF